MLRADGNFSHRSRIAPRDDNRDISDLQLLAGLGNMAEAFDHQPADRGIFVALGQSQIETFIEARNRRPRGDRQRIGIYDAR